MKLLFCYIIVSSMLVTAQTDTTKSEQSLNIEAIQSKTPDINESINASSETKFVLAKDYLFLKNGNTLSGKVFYEKGIFYSGYFIYNDTAKYYIDEVKAFANSDGHFAKVKDSYEFVKRVIEGKIDYYKETETWYNPGSINTVNTPYGSFTTFSPGNTVSVSYDYFSKDGGDVIDASYGNLREAMADNLKSLQLLDEYRNLGYWKWGGVLGGLGIIAAGVVGMDKENPPNFGLVLLGGAISNLAYWIITPKETQKFREAIHVYNGLRK